METILVVVMLTAVGIIPLFGIGFFTLKLELPSKRIKKMDKMEEFFKNDKKINKDVDYFFSEQWKPYLQFKTKDYIISTVTVTLIILTLGILLCFSNEEDDMKSAKYLFGFTGIFFSVMCLGLVIGLLKTIKYKNAFSKAKKGFCKAYPFYTEQKLNHEIVKCDNDRIELGASFIQYDIIWFCSDFLMYGRMYGYIFIRYEEIEYILVKKPGHTSYRSIRPDLYYRFCIYYQINGEEKKFTFLSLSDYPLVREFKKKHVEVSEVSTD